MSATDTWVWGNQNAALGIGSAVTDAPSPVLVSSPVQFLDCSTSNTTDTALRGHAIALFLGADGHVYFAGTDNTGGAGNGGSLDPPSGIVYSTPVQIPGLSNIVRAVAGDSGNYALDTSGRLWGWGYNRSGGLLGPSDPFTAVTATVLATNVVDFDTGGDFVVTLLGSGDVQVVGAGNGAHTAATTTWVTVTPSGSAVIRVLSGLSGLPGNPTVVCADGSVKGANAGSWSTSLLTGAIDACVCSVGTGATIILRADGTVWVLGDNTNGVLGIGSVGGTVTTPTQWINPGSAVVKLPRTAAGGALHVLCADGKVYTSGGSGPVSGFPRYYLGDGTTNGNVSTPSWLNGLIGVQWIGSMRTVQMVVGGGSLSGSGTMQVPFSVSGYSRIDRPSVMRVPVGFGMGAPVARRGRSSVQVIG